MSRGGIIMLHRLKRMLHIRHSVGAPGLREQLIGCDRLLMVDLRRDVARDVRIVGGALIVSRAVKGMSGITLVRLSQREIFASRRDGSAMMVTGKLGSGEVLRMLE